MEHVTNFVEGHLDDFEEDLDQPIGERLLKMVIVGTVGIIATSIASAIYDLVRRGEDEEEAPELVAVPSE